jgi:hypothetical protein
MTGQLIIRDIVSGERDPKALARHRNGRVKASAEEITKALTGTGAMSICSDCTKRSQCMTTSLAIWPNATRSCRRC